MIARLTPLQTALFIVLIGLVPLAGALISQYAFGYAPCKLCLLQRYPYALVMALGVIAFIKPNHLNTALMLTVLACLVSAGLGVFHTGVEQGWWQYESGCTTKAGAAGSLESLREAINASPIVACDQAMLEVGGLSMASWNSVYALGMAWALLYMRRRNVI